MTRPADIPPAIWEKALIYVDAMPPRPPFKNDVQLSIARAILAATEAERERCVQAGSAEVMRFRARIGKRYYAGYHEDMRDAVAAAIRKATP